MQRLPVACGSALVTGVLLGIAVLLPGCSNGDGDSTPGQVPKDSPVPVGADFVGTTAAVPARGDVVIVQFDRAVIVDGSSVQGFVFARPGDTFGDAPTLGQSVVGSDRVEITLGENPILVAGAGGSEINLSNSGNGIVEIVGTNGYRAAAASRFLPLEDSTAVPPELLGASFIDSDANGAVDRGDAILASFHKPITVPPGATVAENFLLPVAGDSFGTEAGLAAATTLATNRSAWITLGEGAVLTVAGTFDPAVLAPGSPSGLDVAFTRTITDTVAGVPSLAAPGGSLDVSPVVPTAPGDGRDASVVLGKPDPFLPRLTSQGLHGPTGIDSCSGTLTIGSTSIEVSLLFVCDTANDRVLIFQDFLGGSFAPASWVLGQPDFSAATSDSPFSSTVPAPSASTLLQPTGIAFDAATNSLFVADTGNNRVMVWRDLFAVSDGTLELELANGSPADFAIGQDGLDDGEPNRGQSAPSSVTLSAPASVRVADGNVAVADTGNHRVLVYSFVPTASDVLPTLVVGQPDFNSGAPNQGGAVGSGTLLGPRDVFISRSFDYGGSGGVLAVADTGNNRVLLYDIDFARPNPEAAVILGQPDATTSAPGLSSTALRAPSGLSGDPATLLLYIADNGNSRLIVHDASGGISTGAAGTAIGQASPDEGEPNRGGLPAADTLSYPARVLAVGTTLVVSDFGNHRVLAYEGAALPEGDADATLVLGQPSFETGTPDASKLGQPTDALVIGGRLIVADPAGNRVLIYDPVPSSGDPDPNVVLGQADLQATLPNRGGDPTADTLRLPAAVATDGTRLVVSDRGNHRVLIWSSIPATTGAPADVILGQPSADVGLPNAGGAPDARTLSSPGGLAVGDGSLVVADSGNNRVLVYPSLATLASFAAATLVLGQKDFTSTSANRGGLVFPGSLSSPSDVLFGGGRLYVADTGNHRVLVWSQFPTKKGQYAEGLYGQLTFASSVMAPAAPETLLYPSGLSMDPDGEFLVVADTGHHRILFYDYVAGTQPSKTSAVGVLGQKNLFTGEPNGGQDAPGPATLFGPTGVFWDGYQLAAADSGNGRLLIYR